MRDRDRLQTLYTINTTLKQIEADGLNINPILLNILDLAVKEVNAKEGSIIVVNQQNHVEHVWITDIAKKEFIPPGFLNKILLSGIGGKAIRNKQSYLIGNTQTHPDWVARPGHPTSQSPWSILCVPLMVRDRAIGAVTLHKPGENQFHTEDLDLLQIIADQSATSIENARLFEFSQRQLLISALLNEASRVINSSLKIDEIMHTLLSQMNEFLNAEAISIALVDSSTNELVYQVAQGAGSEKIVGLRLPLSQGLSGWVIQNCKPALVIDTAKDPRFHDMGDQRTGHPTEAMICAPMQFKGEALGTIQAINPSDGTFTDQDLDLLVNLANIASTAIANAQQYAKTQAAEARYMTLFEDTIDPIILTDLDGRIIEANRRSFEVLGYGRNNLINSQIKNLHPDTTKLPKTKKIKANKVTVFQSELVNKNKEHIPVDVYVTRTQHGTEELLQWIHHDISKQAELEQMRDDLTAMLFHDLQSPLGNVIASLELLSYEIPPNSEGTPLFEMLDIARRSSLRLQTLIRSILDINQLEVGHPVSERTRVDVHNLIDEVYESERPGFEQRRVHFKKEIPADIPPVYAEEDMLKRVFINLISNALKYSTDEKTITIVAQHLVGEDMVLLLVNDQGIGIPDEYKLSIFEKFERIDHGDPNSKGLGLGLAFCRLAVEAHGGKIWVEDSVGGGSSFRLTLPVALGTVPEETGFEF